MMIIREIKDDPDKELVYFDYFNDYRDTVRWCRVNCPEIIPRLEKGYNAWVKRGLL